MNLQELMDGILGVLGPKENEAETGRIFVTSQHPNGELGRVMYTTRDYLGGSPLTGPAGARFIHLRIKDDATMVLFCNDINAGPTEADNYGLCYKVEENETEEEFFEELGTNIHDWLVLGALPISDPKQ